jgi:enoyl-CoA hydratase/carnithine racemase
MKEQDSLLVKKEAGVCTLTINRPEKRNALNQEIYSRLAEVFRSISEDEQTRVAVLRGAGEKAFSAGYEISGLHIIEDLDIKDPLEDVILAIESCTVPVIAMIYGYCIAGGCALAIACDLRLAADNAILGVTAAKLGVVYPPSAIIGLINAVGISATKELLYTGRLIDAERAREIRMVDHVVPVDKLAAVTYDMAREIADNSPLSVRGIKSMISGVLDYQALSPETRAEFLALQKQSTESQDLKEGQKAFAEKRKPRFTGK